MKTKVKFTHPFRVIGWRVPNGCNWLVDDTRVYGFDLDLTTCLYHYTYDWGYGYMFRVLGFGVNINTYGPL